MYITIKYNIQLIKVTYNSKPLLCKNMFYLHQIILLIESYSVNY